ncbi:branched-chain amino acid ABC transporter ATP-binding protein/permease [Microbacterium aurantiacum]|uniref:branched-chain amino acid ABC transporter ATP-binding protein/permease n=1 Tax=Microbacterium aurantiacum TaxID=162393 RepID=UPI004037347D
MTVVSLAIAGVLAFVLPDYWLLIATSAVVSMLSLIGLGIVTGSAGMIALCQMTFAAVGAWIVDYLMTKTSLPAALGGVAFIVAMLVGALAAAFLGFIVGLPALRLRGVNLAVVTLGVAAAADLTIERVSFPDQWDNSTLERPFGIPGISDLSGNRDYFLFAVVVVAVIALGVYFVQRSRIGASWRSVAFSERVTAAAGTSVVAAKLSAFTVSAFVGGVAGAVLIGLLGTANYGTFSTLSSLGLYLLSIAVGAHLISMTVVGALIFVLVPELLKRLGLPLDWASIVFAALGLLALTTNSNLGDDLRNIARRRRVARGSLSTASRLATLPAPESSTATVRPSTEVVLDVSGLRVEFGAVKALGGVDLQVHQGEILGLIGPNGAGKSTLIDALTGFIPAHHGSVRLEGASLDQLPPHHIARAGLRRTFQQDRVPSTMTVGAYVRYLSRGQASREAIAQALDHFGCPPAQTPLQMVDVGTRRIVEVAANLAARPVVLLLDEPAAGLSHEEHLAFAARLAAVPERFGTTLVIVEHDLDLVRSVCTSLTVLDFGRVLATGSVAEVLVDPDVVKAYMGEGELL